MSPEPPGIAKQWTWDDFADWCRAHYDIDPPTELMVTPMYRFAITIAEAEYAKGYEDALEEQRG